MTDAPRVRVRRTGVRTGVRAGVRTGVGRADPPVSRAMTGRIDAARPRTTPSSHPRPPRPPARRPVPAAWLGLWLLAAVGAAGPRRLSAQTPVFGVHGAGPIRASLAAGVWIGEHHPRHDDASGMIAVVEPGLRGGRVSLGYAYSLSGLGSFVTGRATALRTWRMPGGPRNYAGAEVQLLPLFAVGARLSAFVPVDRGPRRVLWLLDAGIGL
jgi:hypothetical protein